jgi:hypothetical protein
MTEGAPLPRRNAVPDPESWERRRASPAPRSFFQLQYDFATIIAEKTGQSILDAIHENAPYMNRQLYNFEDGKEELLERDPGIDIVDFAYGKYIEDYEESKNEPIPYNVGTRFGCFMYDYPKEESEDIYLHFINVEFDPKGPLSSEKIAERERDVTDVLKDIKRQRPTAKTVHGNSWLYNLDTYKRLFPASYIESLRPDEGQRQWSAGATLWGQFLDSDQRLKSDLALVLLERARNFDFEQGTQNDLLTPPLMRAFYVEGPIEDFYKKYGIA